MTLMDQNLIYRTNITDANEQGGKYTWIFFKVFVVTLKIVVLHILHCPLIGPDLHFIHN